MWLKMSEIAKELDVSKDVVKYHRKSLSEEQVKKIDGEIFISPEGIELIKSKLKKDTYHANFETYVRQSLKRLDDGLGMVNHLLLDNLSQTDKNVPTPPKEPNLATELATVLDNSDFQTWYAQKKNYSFWSDWQKEHVLVKDLQEFITLNQLN